MHASLVPKCHKTISRFCGIIEDDGKISLWQESFHIRQRPWEATPLVFFRHIMATLFDSRLHPFDVDLYRSGPHKYDHQVEPGFLRS